MVSNNKDGRTPLVRRQLFVPKQPHPSSKVEPNTLETFKAAAKQTKKSPLASFLAARSTILVGKVPSGAEIHTSPRVIESGMQGTVIPASSERNIGSSTAGQLRVAQWNREMLERPPVIDADKKPNKKTPERTNKNLKKKDSNGDGLIIGS